MGRHKNPIPAYRYHLGRGVVDVVTAADKRTRVYLPGDYNSDESKVEYTKLLEKLRVHGGKLPARPGERLPDDLTITELIAKFLIE